MLKVCNNLFGDKKICFPRNFYAKIGICALHDLDRVVQEPLPATIYFYRYLENLKIIRNRDVPKIICGTTRTRHFLKTSLVNLNKLIDWKWSLKVS